MGFAAYDDDADVTANKIVTVNPTQGGPAEKAEVSVGERIDFTHTVKTLDAEAGLRQFVETAELHERIALSWELVQLAAMLANVTILPGVTPTLDELKAIIAGLRRLVVSTDV